MFKNTRKTTTYLIITLLFLITTIIFLKTITVNFRLSTTSNTPIEYTTTFPEELNKSERIESLLEKLDQVNTAVVNIDENGNCNKVKLTLDKSKLLTPENRSKILQLVNNILKPNTIDDILITN